MRLALSLLVRGLVLTGLWWVLVEGRTGYAAYGLVAVPLGVAVSLWLMPAGGWVLPAQPQLRGAQLVRRVRGVLALGGWYSWQVTTGGVDVARRLLRWEADVAPVVRRCRSRLPEGPARQLAVGMYGLMPGALVSGTDGDAVWLHSLDASMDPEQQWRDLEEHIARAAGEELVDPG